jgi:heterodisulfide reductase subunit B
VTLEEVKKRVKKPLKGLKLAAYYGCYLVRPPDITQFDNSENPMMLDNLLRACGAETVDYTHKVECCGGSLLLARTDIVMKLVDDICQAALDAGAVGIVTACPLCMANLDTRQPKTKGLALGAEKKQTDAWWKKHINSPIAILKAQGLI